MQTKPRPHEDRQHIRIPMRGSRASRAVAMPSRAFTDQEWSRIKDILADQGLSLGDFACVCLDGLLANKLHARRVGNEIVLGIPPLSE